MVGSFVGTYPAGIAVKPVVGVAARWDWDHPWPSEPCRAGASAPTYRQLHTMTLTAETVTDSEDKIEFVLFNSCVHGRKLFTNDGCM